MKKNQKSVTYDADLSPWFYQLNGLQWSMMLTSVHDSINSMVYNDLWCWPQSMILSTPWFTMIYNADLSQWFYQLRGLQWFTTLTSVHDSINSMVYNDLWCWPRSMILSTQWLTERSCVVRAVDTRTTTASTAPAASVTCSQQSSIHHQRSDAV